MWLVLKLNCPSPPNPVCRPQVGQRTVRHCERSCKILQPLQLISLCGLEGNIILSFDSGGRISQVCPGETEAQVSAEAMVVLMRMRMWQPLPSKSSPALVLAWFKPNSNSYVSTFSWHLCCCLLLISLKLVYMENIKTQVLKTKQNSD